MNITSYIDIDTGDHVYELEHNDNTYNVQELADFAKEWEKIRCKISYLQLKTASEYIDNRDFVHEITCFDPFLRAWVDAFENSKKNDNFKVLHETTEHFNLN